MNFSLTAIPGVKHLREYTRDHLGEQIDYKCISLSQYGQIYFLHMYRAFTLSYTMLKGFIETTTHAMFPCLFTKCAQNCHEKLTKQLSFADRSGP